MSIITINARDALTSGVDLRVDVYTVGPLQGTEYHADLTPYQVRKVKRYFKGMPSTHALYVEYNGKQYHNVRAERNIISWR